MIIYEFDQRRIKIIDMKNGKKVYKKRKRICDAMRRDARRKKEERRGKSNKEGRKEEKKKIKERKESQGSGIKFCEEDVTDRQPDLIISSHSLLYFLSSITCSLTTGLTSYALTTAPMLLAVPMDARPATPAPVTVWIHITYGNT